MKVLVTGVNGQLGFDVMQELERRGHNPIGCGRTQLNLKNYFVLDITDEKKVKAILSLYNFDAIVHCAAWTNVDGAEKKENQDLVYKINVLGTRFLAEASLKNKAKFIYISTDYVFSGLGDVPFLEDSCDFAPLNFYGLTKLKGEEEVKKILTKYYIVRISWVFGLNGQNFVKTILKLSQNHSQIEVVSDQFGLPTYTYHLAKLLADMLEQEKYGIYHATNEGDYISWFEFAKKICDYSNISMIVKPVLTENYLNSIAKRPLNSRLNTSKLEKVGFQGLPPWQMALKEYLDALNKQREELNLKRSKKNLI